MAADKTDFTQGSILKKMVAFMIPILGALILQAAYGAVDLLVVGRYGSTSGLSAVSTGSQVLNLVTFVVTQLAMGVTVLIARYLGEKRAEQIGSVIGGSAVVFAGISVLLFILMVLFAHPISVLMLHQKRQLPLHQAMCVFADVEFSLSWHIMCWPLYSEEWETANPRCYLFWSHVSSISWGILFWLQDFIWMQRGRQLRL